MCNVVLTSNAPGLILLFDFRFNTNVVLKANSSWSQVLLHGCLQSGSILIFNFYYTLYPHSTKNAKKNYTHLHSRMNAEWSQGNDPSTKTVISSLETLSRVILYTLKRFLRTNYFPHSFEIELSNLLVKIMCKVKGGFDGTFFFVWIFSAALGYMLTCYLMDRMPIAG